MTGVDASATLKLYMMQFDNPSGFKYTGVCCDVLCNACDPRFLFLVDARYR